MKEVPNNFLCSVKIVNLFISDIEACSETKDTPDLVRKKSFLIAVIGRLAFDLTHLLYSKPN